MVCRQDNYALDTETVFHYSFFMAKVNLKRFAIRTVKHIAVWLALIVGYIVIRLYWWK